MDKFADPRRVKGMVLASMLAILEAAVWGRARGEWLSHRLRLRCAGASCAIEGQFGHAGPRRKLGVLSRGRSGRTPLAEDRADDDPGAAPPERGAGGGGPGLSIGLAAERRPLLTDPPATLPSDVPNFADPRGFLTFGLAGLAILVVASVMSRDARFPRNLAWLGYLSGTLLLLIYLGRLIVLDPASPLILAPAALEGFVVNPAWYVWLGTVLWRGTTA